MKQILLTTLMLLLALPVVAKGPKDPKGVPSKYSNQLPTSSKSKYAKSPPVSRLPTQVPLSQKYPKPTRRTPSASLRKKYDLYQKQRPTTRPSSSRPTPPVRFPTRPTGSQKPTRPSQRPPVIFYPPGGKKPSRPTERPSAQRPTQLPSRPGNDRYPRPSLRPDSSPSRPDYSRRPIIINRPTTINQSTVNITKETNITNQWYSNNHWQDRVTINPDHWNGRPWWYQPDYGSWHHGHWHAHHVSGGIQRDDWRYVQSSAPKWLHGLAAWGLGNLIYRTGYQVYQNPYRVRTIVIGSTRIDYTRPIAVQLSAYERAYANDQAKAEQLRTVALGYFESARRAFYGKDYNKASENIHRGLALMPDDTSMHEFRALVLFAVEKYPEAAEAIHAVLAVAPGWDWTTLSGLYRDNNDYARQLRNLENYSMRNSREASAHFLLAYHYITLGHHESAIRELQTTLRLQPNDRLSADLLSLLSQEQQPPQTQLPEAIPAAQFLLGEWEARRARGKIELEFENEEFVWDYDLEDNDRKFRGKYLLSQDVLVLASQEGSQMVGRVRKYSPDKFVFQLLGSSEPGIVFERD